jgi:hypothetical protein
MFEIVYVIWRGARRPIEAHVHVGKIENRHIPSMDSDLEAFSHNPTVGGFAPLPFQASA